MTENEDGALDGGGIFAETEERTGELQVTPKIFLFGPRWMSWIGYSVCRLGEHTLRKGRNLGGKFHNENLWHFIIIVMVVVIIT